MSGLGHYARHLRNFTCNMVNMILPRAFFINVYSFTWSIICSLIITFALSFSFFQLLLNVMKFVLLTFKVLLRPKKQFCFFVGFQNYVN